MFVAHKPWASGVLVCQSPSGKTAEKGPEAGEQTGASVDGGGVVGGEGVC